MAERLSTDASVSHFGVKGMRWGVRRSGDISVSGTTRPRVSTDAQKVIESKKVVKKGSVNSLSTKELQDLVTRMNLEQQFSRLNDKPSTLKRGLNFVNTILSAGNTANQAMQFANSPAGKTISDQIKKNFAKKIVSG